MHDILTRGWTERDVSLSFLKVFCICLCLWTLDIRVGQKWIQWMCVCVWGGVRGPWSGARIQQQSAHSQQTPGPPGSSCSHGGWTRLSPQIKVEDRAELDSELSRMVSCAHWRLHRILRTRRCRNATGKPSARPFLLIPRKQQVWNYQLGNILCFSGSSSSWRRSGADMFPWRCARASISAPGLWTVRLPLVPHVSLDYNRGHWHRSSTQLTCVWGLVVFQETRAGTFLCVWVWHQSAHSDGASASRPAAAAAARVGAAAVPGGGGGSGAEEGLQEPGLHGPAGGDPGADVRAALGRSDERLPPRAAAGAAGQTEPDLPEHRATGPGREEDPPPGQPAQHLPLGLQVRATGARSRRELKSIQY